MPGPAAQRKRSSAPPPANDPRPRGRAAIVVRWPVRSRGRSLRAARRPHRVPTRQGDFAGCGPSPSVRPARRPGPPPRYRIAPDRRASAAARPRTTRIVPGRPSTDAGRPVARGEIPEFRDRRAPSVDAIGRHGPWMGTTGTKTPCSAHHPGRATLPRRIGSTGIRRDAAGWLSEPITGGCIPAALRSAPRPRLADRGAAGRSPPRTRRQGRRPPGTSSRPVAARRDRRAGGAPPPAAFRSGRCRRADGAGGGRRGSPGRRSWPRPPAPRPASPARPSTGSTGSGRPSRPTRPPVRRCPRCRRACRPSGVSGDPSRDGRDRRLQ